jgi:hypothetical protein
MIKAITPDQTFEYICESDRGSEQPTKWVLGILDSRLMAHIEDAVAKLEMGKKGSDQADPVFRTGTRRWLLVKFGLRGWVNFVDANGQPFAESFDTTPLFGKSYKTVNDRVLELIPTSVLTELAGELSEQNHLQEADKRPFG